MTSNDDYAQNRLSRSEFVKKLSLYAVGSLTITSLMSFLMPDYKDTIQIHEQDPRLDERYIVYDSPKGNGKIKAFLCMPKDNDQKLGTIVVVHENRGLNPHIADVARRAALTGYLVIAPDALSPFGGYPGNDDKGRDMQRKLDRNAILEDFIAAAEYIKDNEHSNGEIGVVGFCFGGWVSNMLAVRMPDLAAAVPFYGDQAPEEEEEEVAKIKAPLQLHFAELDTNVNEGWPAYEQALKKQNKEYTAFIYAGANHGFHNDSTPRYNKKAAELAWTRTMAFFNEKLHW